MTLLYRGYIPLDGKKAIMGFKNKTSEELLTLEQASSFNSYGGVLSDNTILIDIDDLEQSDILFNIVQTKQLKCKVIETTRGKHFLFRVDRPIPNRTHIKLGIGLTADIKPSFVYSALYCFLNSKVCHPLSPSKSSFHITF